MSHAKIGQLPISWGTDRDEAVARAHDQFRWFAGGWKVNAELPGPAAFASATQFVRQEDVAEALACGPDVTAHVEAVRPFVDAGFTHVALVQVGGETQPEFLDLRRARTAARAPRGVRQVRRRPDQGALSRGPPTVRAARRPGPVERECRSVEGARRGAGGVEPLGRAAGRAKPLGRAGGRAGAGPRGEVGPSRRRAGPGSRAAVRVGAAGWPGWGPGRGAGRGRRLAGLGAGPRCRSGPQAGRAGEPGGRG